MLSLRILTVDSYQCSPVKEYDVCYSDFRGSEIYKVPVIRVVGNTPAGQKGCLHIHGVFPYLSVRCKDVFPGIDVKSSREYTQKLALEIDKALNVEERKTASNPHHVYNIEVTQRLCLYGYHEEEEDFLKIYFYNPIDVMRTANNLTSCKVMNKFIQPHEAHIPFILQFFIDHNLFGMNFIKTSSFKFRASEETFIAATSPLRNQDISHSDDSDIANKVWDVSSLSSSQINGLQRESVCELEADCCKSDIINQKEISSQHGNNPGLESIWAEEKLRRQAKNETSQISFEGSQERNRVQTQNEVLYKRLENILNQRDHSADLNKSKEIDESHFQDSQNILSNESLSDLFGLSNTDDKQLIQVFMDLANSQANLPDEDSILGTKNELSKEDDDAEEAEMSQRDNFDFLDLSSSLVSCEEVNTNLNDATNVQQLDGTYDDEDSASFVPKLSKEVDDVSPRCQSDSNFSDEPPILEPENDLSECITNNIRETEKDPLDSNFTMQKNSSTSQNEQFVDEDKTVLPSDVKVLKENLSYEESKSSNIESPKLGQNSLSPCKAIDCDTVSENKSVLKDSTAEKTEKYLKALSEVSKISETSIIKPCSVAIIRNEYLDQFVKSKSSHFSSEKKLSSKNFRKTKLGPKIPPFGPKIIKEKREDEKHKSKHRTMDDALKSTPLKPISSETNTSDTFLKKGIDSELTEPIFETKTPETASLIPNYKEVPPKVMLPETSFTDSNFMPMAPIKQEPLSPVNENGGNMIYNPYADANLYDYTCQESINSISDSFRQFEPNVFSSDFANSFYSKQVSFEKAYSSLSDNNESNDLLPLMDTSIVKVEEVDFDYSDSNQSSSTRSSKVGSEYVKLKKLTDEDILHFTSKSSDNSNKSSENSTSISRVKSSSKNKPIPSAKQRISNKNKKDLSKNINSKYIDPTKKYPENPLGLDFNKNVNTNVVTKPKENKRFQNEIASMVNAAMDSFPSQDDNILISSDNPVYSDALDNVPPCNNLQSFELGQNATKKHKSSKSNSFQSEFMSPSLCDVTVQSFNDSHITHKNSHTSISVKNSSSKQNQLNQLKFQQIHPYGAKNSKKSSNNSGTKTEGEIHGRKQLFNEEKSLDKSKFGFCDKRLVEANSFSSEQEPKKSRPSSPKKPRVSENSPTNLDALGSLNHPENTVEDFKSNQRDKLEVSSDKSKKIDSDKIKKIKNEKNKKLESGKNMKDENGKSKRDFDKNKKVDSKKNKKGDTDKIKKVDTENKKKVDSEKIKKGDNEKIKKVDNEKIKKVESDKSKQVENDKSKTTENDKSKKVENDKNKKLETGQTKNIKTDKSKKIEKDKSKKAEADQSKRVIPDKSKGPICKSTLDVPSDVNKKVKSDKSKNSKFKEVLDVSSDLSKKVESDKSKISQCKEIHKDSPNKDKEVENGKNKKIDNESRNSKSKEIKSLSLKKNKRNLNETTLPLVKLDTVFSSKYPEKAVKELNMNSRKNLEGSPDKSKKIESDSNEESKQKEVKSLSLKKNKLKLNESNTSSSPKKEVSHEQQDNATSITRKQILSEVLSRDSVEESTNPSKQEQLKDIRCPPLNKGLENDPGLLKTSKIQNTSDAYCLPLIQATLPVKLPIVKLQKLSDSELIKYKSTIKNDLLNTIDPSSTQMGVSFTDYNHNAEKGQNETNLSEAKIRKEYSKKCSKDSLKKLKKSSERCVKCNKKIFKCKCQSTVSVVKTEECKQINSISESKILSKHDYSEPLSKNEKNKLLKSNSPEKDPVCELSPSSRHLNFTPNSDSEFSSPLFPFDECGNPSDSHIYNPILPERETAACVQNSDIMSPSSNNSLALNDFTEAGSLEFQVKELNFEAVLPDDTKSVIPENSIEFQSDIDSEICISNPSHESKDAEVNPLGSTSADGLKIHSSPIPLKDELEVSTNQSNSDSEKNIYLNCFSPRDSIPENSLESSIQSVKSSLVVECSQSENKGPIMIDNNISNEPTSNSLPQKNSRRFFSSIRSMSNRLSLKLNKKENSVLKAKNVLQNNAKKKWMVDRRLFGESKFAVKKRSKDRVSEIVSDSCLRIKLGSPENTQCDKQSISKVLLKGKSLPNFKDSSGLISEKKINYLAHHSKTNKDIPTKQKARMQKLNYNVKSHRQKKKNHVKDKSFKIKSKSKQSVVELTTTPTFISRHPRKCKEKPIKDSGDQCGSSLSELHSNKTHKSDPYSSDDSVKIIDTVKPVKSPRKHSHKEKCKHLKVNSKRKHSSDCSSPAKVSSKDINEETLSPSAGIPKMKISLKWLTTRNNETRIVVVNKELKGLRSDNASDSDSVQEIFRYEPEKAKSTKRRRLSSSHRQEHHSDECHKATKETSDESKKIAPLKINLSSSRVTCEEVEKIKTLTLKRNLNSFSIDEYAIKKEILSDEETSQNENDFVSQQVVHPIKRPRGRPRKVPPLNIPMTVQKTISPQKDISPLKYQSSFYIDNSSPTSKIRILKKQAADCVTKIDNSLQLSQFDNNFSSSNQQIIGGVVIKQEIDSDDYMEEIKIPKRRGRKPGKVRKSESISQTSFEIINDTYPDKETLSSPIFTPANRVITRRESLRPRHEVKYFPTDQNSDEEKEKQDVPKSPRKRARKNSAPGKISSDSTKDVNFTSSNRRMQVQNLLESCNSFTINLKKLSSKDISNLTAYRKESNPQNIRGHIDKVSSQDSDVEIISDTINEIKNSYNYSSEHMSQKRNVVQSNMSTPYDGFSHYGNPSNMPPVSSNLSNMQNMSNYFEPLEQPSEMRSYNSAATNLTYDQSHQDDLLPPWDIQPTYSDDPVKQEMSSPIDSNPDVLNSGYFSPCNYNIPESSLEQENTCNFSQPQPNFAEQNYSYGTNDRSYSYLPDCMNAIPKTFNDLSNEPSIEKSVACHSSISNINSPILNDIDQFNLSCSPTSHPSTCETSSANALQKTVNSFESQKISSHYPLELGYNSQNVHNNISEIDTRKRSSSYDHVINSINDLTPNINFHSRCEEPFKINPEQHLFTNKDCRLSSSPHIRPLSNHMQLEARPSEGNELFPPNKNSMGNNVLDSSHDDSSFDITSDKMDISPASDAFLMDGHAFSDNHSSPHENKLTDNVQIPARNNEGNMNFFNRNPTKTKTRQFAEPVIPNFENKSSHFEVRTFDLSEGMIESDSELHPLGAIGLNPIEDFKNAMPHNLNNSNFITNCTNFEANQHSIANNSVNFIPTLPVKPLVPTYYPEVATKTSQPLYQPTNDVLNTSNFIARAGPEIESGTHPAVTNTIINPGNAASLFEIPYNCNMISVCDPLSEDLYYATHSSANRASINFVPTVMVAEPATHQVNVLYNTAPIIVTGSSVNEESLNCSQRNELVQSCSVSSTSDTDTPSNTQSVIQSKPNEKLDILSVAVKECNIGEEYDPDNELLEEDKSVYSPDLQLGKKDQFYFKTNTPNCNSPDTLCTNIESTPKNSPYSRDMQKDFLGRSQHNFSPQPHETNAIEIDRKHPNDFGVMETAVPSPQKKHKHTLGLVSSVPKSVLCGDKQNPFLDEKNLNSELASLESPLNSSSLSSQNPNPSPELFNEVELPSHFNGSVSEGNLFHPEVTQNMLPCLHSDEQQHKNRVLNKDSCINSDKIPKENVSSFKKEPTLNSQNQNDISQKKSECRPFLGKQLDTNQLKTRNSFLTSTLLKQIEKHVNKTDILKMIQKSGCIENIENVISLKLRKTFNVSNPISKENLKNIYVNNENICFPLFSQKNNSKCLSPSAEAQNEFKDDDESGSFIYNDTIQSFYGDETLCEINSSLTLSNDSRVGNTLHNIKKGSNLCIDDREKEEKSSNSDASGNTTLLQPLRNVQEQESTESSFDKLILVYPEKPPRPCEVRDWVTNNFQNKKGCNKTMILESQDEGFSSSDESIAEDGRIYQNSNFLKSVSNSDVNEESDVKIPSETNRSLLQDIALNDQETSSNFLMKPPQLTKILESTPNVSRIQRKTFIPEEIGVSPINRNNLLTRDTDAKKCLFSDGILPAPRHQKLKNIGKESWDKKLQNNTVSNHNLTSSQIDGPTLDNSRGFKVNSINNEDVKESHEVQHLTLMSLEIHVNTRQSYMPDPRFDSIAAVFFNIYYDAGINEKKVIGVIHVNSSHANPSDRSISDMKNVLESENKLYDCQFFSVPSEMMLFEKLVTIVRNWDPDIMIGYEIQMASWGYLKSRAAVLSVNLISLLSRLAAKKGAKGSNIQIDPTVTDQTADLDSLVIPGRIVLNVWRIMRKEINLNTYSFENVYFHALHRRTPKYTFEDLTCWYQGMKKSVVARYYISRVVGTIKLLEKFDVVRRTSELARLFGIQFYDVLSRGSQFRVESMMLRTAKPFLFVPVSPSTVQRAHSRAPECVPLILEPESNFYTDPVVVLDFQSLYPSMIIAYNYCFSTCLGRLEHFGKNVPFDFGCTSLTVPLPLLHKLWKENNIHISPTGIAFVNANVRRGVLPTMLEEILNTRIMVKRSLKKNKDNIFLKKLLDARQLGLKLIANVTYGYTGASFSGRMPCVEVADSIVGKGRETLENAIHIIENTPEWKAKVVYGDTDSLFILLKGRSKEEAFKIGQEIADTVTSTNPKPVKLKFEKVYLPCVLQTKKRYVGYMYETIDQKIPTYDAKGIETVRRDTCPATAKILQRSLKVLFETYNISLVEKYVQKQFSRILKERVNLSDFIFAKEYRGINGYRPGACVPALEIAKKRLSKDPRSEPRVGERVPYVIVYGFPGMPIIRLVREPIELVKDYNLRLNATYYITRVIIPPLERVFNLIKADVKAWYTSIAHKITFNLPMAKGLNQNKGTLTQFFKTQNCPCCSKTTTSPICEYCHKDPQGTVITLTEKIRKWEKAVIQIGQVCASCTKSLSSDCGCISVDCPVLFKLNLSKRDLSQAPYLRGLINQELF